MRGDEIGMRLDRLLVTLHPELGRAHAARLCSEGAVRVNGRARRKNFLVASGDTVEARVGNFGAALPAPEIQLSIVLETPDFVIVDKAAGVPCGSLVGKEQGTLAGALLHHFPEMQHVGYGRREPGLVHRLDNQTSGLVLAARHQRAFVALQSGLSRGLLTKKYLALVAPNVLPDRGHVRLPLAPHPQDRRRVIVVSAGGHPSETVFEVLRRGRDADLAQVSVHAAYRHQIRCHLAHRGASLLGDEVYGSRHPVLGARHALHASYIAGDVAGLPGFAVESPLPEDLGAILDRDT